MKKLITATALFLALATASGAVPYNAADNTFSAYAVGPGLNNLSVKDDKASYQWALKNDGQAQKIVQINIKNQLIGTDLFQRQCDAFKHSIFKASKLVFGNQIVAAS